ncbi:MAG: hypothetical protein ACK5MZ_07140 [Aestuariibaculum sp.]
MEHKKLHNINNSGFKVPESYFNHLENTLLSEIKLKEAGNVSGFKLPQNYLETLENKITQKLKQEDKPKVIPLFKKNIIYATSIAAAIVLLLTLIPSNTQTNWNNLDTDTLENYMINEVDLDTYEIANLFTNQLLDETGFTELNFNEETLENYLLSNSNLEDLITDEN